MTILWLGPGAEPLVGHAGPVLASIHTISDTAPGVEQTLRQMRRLILKSSQDPVVIGWAQDVVRFFPERDTVASAATAGAAPGPGNGPAGPMDRGGC